MLPPGFGRTTLISSSSLFHSHDVCDAGSRPSALHASRNQTAASAARVAATCSTAAPLTVVVYAQPPCTCTSSGVCSADPSLAIANAAAAAKNKAPFALMNLAVSGLLLVLEP